ncbi:MAG: sodium:solute symporter family transporter [Gemmatimonadota bacterium]
MTGAPVSFPALLQGASLPSVSRPAIVAVAVVYFVVVAVIGAWAMRRTRTADDFFIAGKGIGLIALTLGAMSATLSGFAFIGGPGLVYEVGLGAMYIILPASITSAMGAWALAKRLRLLGEARGLLTIPDAVGVRYGSPVAQGLAGAAILVAVVGYVATNFLALGLVIEAVFGWSLEASIWTGAGVVLAYTVAGGMIAGIYTDVFQGSLMAAASVLVFVYCLDAGGGLGAISTTLAEAEPGFLGPWGQLTPLAALSFYFVFGLGSLGQPQVLHKFYMLRDPRRLKWYPLLVTLALVLAMLLFFGVGVSTRALVAEGDMAPLSNPDQATPLFLLGYTPVLLAGLVFAGVAAAIMSTVNAFVNIGAAVVTHDFPVALGRRLDEELAWGRVATAAITVAAALTAQVSGTLVAFLGIFGWGLFAAALVPSLAIGLNWKGATRAGAVASLAVGLGATLLFETLAYLGHYTFPEGVTVSGGALVLSTLVFFAVSLATGGSEADELPADVKLAMEA